MHISSSSVIDPLDAVDLTEALGAVHIRLETQIAWAISAGSTPRARASADTARMFCTISRSLQAALDQLIERHQLKRFVSAVGVVRTIQKKPFHHPEPASREGYKGQNSPLAHPRSHRPLRPYEGYLDQPDLSDTGNLRPLIYFRLRSNIRFERAMPIQMVVGKNIRSRMATPRQGGAAGNFESFNYKCVVALGVAQSVKNRHTDVAHWSGTQTARHEHVCG